MITLDIESCIDTPLLNKVMKLTAAQDPMSILDAFNSKMEHENKSTFVPWNFHRPAVVSTLWLGEDGILKEASYVTVKYDMRGELIIDHVAMRTMLEKIFVGMGYFHANNRFKKPVIVTFNGKGFDIPVLELMVHLYQMEFSQHDLVTNLLTLPDFRSKFKNTVNYDVQSVLTEMSGGYFAGGLNCVSKKFGGAGKIDTDGSSVHKMLYVNHNIHDTVVYCQTDVLDTLWSYINIQLNRKYQSLLKNAFNTYLTDNKTTESVQKWEANRYAG